MPVNDAQFSVSFPGFISIDIYVSVTGCEVYKREFGQNSKSINTMLARFKIIE